MNEKVVTLRPLPFKVPKPVETQFFSVDDSVNLRFMREDLARSGLNEDDVYAYTCSLLRKDGSSAAYGIPYFGLDGKPLVDKEGFPIMWRARFRLPEFSTDSRYTQPSKEQLLKYDLPAHVPYIHPEIFNLEGDALVCCEGEKKCASVLKILRLPAFGIGGCYMWRDPDRSGSIHRWILQLAERRGIRKFVIIPDGDLMRYDICSAYGTFAHCLRTAGYEVEIIDTGGKIDDLLVSWKEGATEHFSALPRINPDSLVQSPDMLAKRYNLAFKQSSKGEITVLQHTSNIMRLMEEHDAFPKFWRNSDTNRVMVGENLAQPDFTEMEIANYFQHNLRFDKVNHRIVYSCIQALAKKNSRSPFLEYVRGQVWDGTHRLDTWLNRHWGVEDTSTTREIGAKWLVSSCARLDKPGTKLDWIFIVIGPQGTGKTSMPGIIFKGSALTLYGEHNDKDLHMLLHSALCVGFDELDSFGKRESSNLKAMVTRNEDAFRPPYGASVEIFPRRFTLYGCGNRYEFLQHDPSGYRRYAVVEISKLLDFAGLEAERDQLWAEAWTIYQRGACKYWEIDNASENAKKYVIPSVLEDQIIGHLESWKIDKVGNMVKDGKLYFTIIQLLGAMGMEKDGRNPYITREVAAILRSLGAEQRNGTIPTGKVRGRYYELVV